VKLSSMVREETPEKTRAVLVQSEPGHEVMDGICVDGVESPGADSQGQQGEHDGSRERCAGEDGRRSRPDRAWDGFIDRLARYAHCSSGS
jgi:hypothetical protein